MKRKLWSAVLIAAVLVLCIAGTKISRLTQTTSIQGDSLFLVVTGSQANGTLQTRSIEVTNLISALTNLQNWPSTGSGSATNAIATLKTNGANVSTAITSLNVIAGTNVYVNATNTAGVVDLRINSTGGGSVSSLSNSVSVVGPGGTVTNSVIRYWESSQSNTLAAAVGAARDVTFKLGPGHFTLAEDTALVLTNGVRVEGSGDGVTIIDGAYPVNVSPDCAFDLADNCSVAHLTIDTLVQSFTTTRSATNVLIDGVTFGGLADNLSWAVTNAGVALTIENSYGRGAFDQIGFRGTNGSILRIKNSIIEANVNDPRDPTFAQNPGKIVAAFVNNGGTIELINVLVRQTNALLSEVIRSQPTTPLVPSKFVVSGVSYDIAVTNGGLLVPYSFGSYSGGSTGVFVRYLGNQQPFVVTTNSAIWTNPAGPCIVNMTTTSTRTNWLPNIGYGGQVHFEGLRVTIKDAGGSAETSPIYVRGNGAETIDGVAAYTIGCNYCSVTLESKGTNWTVIGNGVNSFGATGGFLTGNIGELNATNIALQGGQLSITGTVDPSGTNLISSLTPEANDASTNKTIMVHNRATAQLESMALGNIGVDWSNLTGVPAGFADGTDDGAGGGGEANVNGEISITNSTKIGLVYGKSGVTNMLRSVQAGYGLINTNQGTNLVGAVDQSIIPSHTELVTASNTLYSTETTRNAAVSNALTALLVANDTTTSNGLFSVETTRNAAVSNALVSLLVANDTFTSNAVRQFASSNIVSLSTSNATSKPLTNSYANGVLQLFGLEVGNNITITPNGSNLVLASTASGSSGGTNYPPVINTLGVTNITVGSGVRQHRTWTTNASFGINFQGTPLNGETIRVGVSNTSASTIYWTNFNGGTLTAAFFPAFASNVSVFAVAPTSIRTIEFVFNTNYNLGTFRQEAQWDSGFEYGLAVSSAGANGFLALQTNATTVAVSNTYIPQASSMVLSNAAGLASTVFTNVPLGGTNISVRTAGGTNFIDTTGQLNNWAGFTTNVWNDRQGGDADLTNVANQILLLIGQADIRTNLNSGSLRVTNFSILSGGYSTAAVSTNGDNSYFLGEIRQSPGQASQLGNSTAQSLLVTNGSTFKGTIQINATNLNVLGTNLVADGNLSSYFSNAIRISGQTNIVVTNLLDGQTITMDLSVTNANAIRICTAPETDVPDAWWLSGRAERIGSNGFTRVTVSRYGVWTNLSSRGILSPSMLMSTNSGATNPITQIVFKSPSIVASNDSQGILSLHVNRSGLYRTIYVDAAAMVSNVTAGATFSTEELGNPTNRMVDSYVFSGTASNIVQFKLAMPLEWDLGTIKVKLWTTSTNNISATTNVWGISASAIKTTSVVTNISWGTELEITNVVSSAGGQAILTPATPAMTVGNTPAAAGQLCWFYVMRKPLDADDNDGGQQKLLGAWIQYREKEAEVAVW